MIILPLPFTAVSLKGHKHSAFPTSHSFTLCKSRFCYQCAHSSTLTKNTNEPLVGKQCGNISDFMSLNLAFQVPASWFSCLSQTAQSESIIDYLSQSSSLIVHFLQVVVLRSLLFHLISLCILPFPGLQIQSFCSFTSNIHSAHSQISTSVLPTRRFYFKQNASKL